MKPNWMTLTEEEIEAMTKALYPENKDAMMSWDSDYGYRDAWHKEYKNKVKHEWKPVLLLQSTVYNCKKCGVAKEEAKDGTYCEDKDDTGGW